MNTYINGSVGIISRKSKFLKLEIPEDQGTVPIEPIESIEWTTDRTCKKGTNRKYFPA